MKQCLVMLTVITLLLATGCVPPEPVLPEETMVFEQAVREEQAPPPVLEVPRMVAMPGQRKAVPSIEEQLAAQACPLCTAKGMSPEQASKEHTHKAYEIIEYANKQSRLEPQTDDFFNAVQVYDYIQGGLYQLYAAPLRETSILLQPGEDIHSVSAGDTKRWVFANVVSGEGDTSQNIILVKPTRPGLETNMVITTEKRTYLIELTSYKKTYMAAISWHYPQEEMIAQLVAIQKTRERERDTIATNIQLDDVNFDYTITGKTNPRWKPVRVFDDGRKTFIQFPAALRTSEAPALFIRSAEGKTQLVNYRVKGNYYIVDRLFDLAELRVGEKTPIIIRIMRRTEDPLTRRAYRAAPRS